MDEFNEIDWDDPALRGEAGTGPDADAGASRAHSEATPRVGADEETPGEQAAAAPSTARASEPHDVLRTKPALGADDGVPTKPFVVAISGASGMIGSALSAALSVPSLANRHHPVVAPLVRRDPVKPNEIKWLPKDDYIDVSKLEGCEAVVNLAGRPLGTSIAGSGSSAEQRLLLWCSRREVGADITLGAAFVPSGFASHRHTTCLCTHVSSPCGAVAQACA